MSLVLSRLFDGPSYSQKDDFRFKRAMIMMNLLSFLSHLLTFLLGILISIPFALLLLYLFTSRFSHASVHPLLLFPSKASKASLLTFPSNEQSPCSTWMVVLFPLPDRRSDRSRLQPIYVKLCQSHLYLHLTSKRLKNLHRTPLTFTHVIIFDISQSTIRLKPFKQLRTQYWSNKTPLILSQIRYLLSYRIIKRSKKQETEQTSSDALRSIDFQWIAEKVMSVTTMTNGEVDYSFPNTHLQLIAKDVKLIPIGIDIWQDVYTSLLIIDLV